MNANPNNYELICYALKKVPPPLKTHGGKSYLARRLLQFLPQRTTYLEPFAGGASMLLNIAPNLFETRILNDLNPQSIAFYVALQNQPDVLLQQLRQQGYSEKTFLAAKARDEMRPPLASVPSEALIPTAVDFFTRVRQSRGGTGTSFAWSDRLRGGQPGDLNAWMNIVHDADGLERISEILQGVEIRCGDGIELLRSMSQDPSVLAYLDPPYPHSTRTVKDAYGAYEMSMDQHRQLAEVANAASCAIAISGYHCPEYDAWYRDWTTYEFDMPNHSSQTEKKSRRVEVLWVNKHRW